MKKTILLLALMAMFVLCSCEDNSNLAAGDSLPASIAGAETTPTAEPTPTIKPTATPKPTPKPTATPAPEVHWTKVVYSLKDKDGYTYDVELKLSPWILTTDSELLNAAWNEVGKGESLPTFDDWGFEQLGSEYGNKMTFYGTDYWQVYGWNISDLYYSVGTITIKNTTSGFDITSDNPRDVRFAWGYDYLSPTVAGRVITSNEEITRMGGISLSAYMERNNWGPAPLILITPEYFSPKTPDGMTEKILSEDFSLDYNGSWLSGDNTGVHLGILKSDGEYITE